MIKRPIKFAIVFITFYIVMFLFRMLANVGDFDIFQYQGYQVICALLFAVLCDLTNYGLLNTGIVLSVFLLWLTSALCKIFANMVLTEREIMHTIEFCLGICYALNTCLCFAAMCRKRAIHLALKFIISLLYGLVVLLPLLVIGYYVVSDGHMLSANILLTLFQTNFDEVRSYLVEQNMLLWSVSIGAILLVTGLFVYIIFNIKSKQMKLHWVALHTVLALLYCFTLLPKLNSNYAVNMYLRVADTLHEYTQYKNISSDRQARIEDLRHILQADDGAQLHVLVIGEATVKHHLSAYGYRYETTPWLDNLKKRSKNVLLFSHAYSNHVQTVMALQQALTSQNQFNTLPLSETSALTEVASAAGYQTYWISNQMHFNTHDTPITAIANGADKAVFINDAVGNKLRTTYYDEKLADYFPEVDEDKKAFVIFHLMGCHNVYADRYPSAFDRFKKEANERVNHYDNCILYNDYVLSLLYQKAAERENFMSFTFLSDHGEDPDNGLTHDYSKFTWNMAHIPLVMIFSDKYIQNHSDIFQNLKNNKDRYWTSDLLYGMMLHILGIRGQIYEDAVKYDLSSDEYKKDKNNLTVINGEKNLADDIAEY